MQNLKQSSTAKPLVFAMWDSTDPATPKTGLSPTVTLSKNGAAFAAPSGAVTEIANGLYKVAGNATDSATLGVLALSATATGAKPTLMAYCVVAYDPDDAAGLGLSRLDATISSRNSTTPPTAAVNASAVRSELATELGRVDAAVSTRSSHTAADIWAVGTRSLTTFGTLVADVATAVWGAATRTLSSISDSSGITTLLSRLTGTRAGLLDNLDAAISSRNATTPPTVGAIVAQITTDHGAGSYVRNTEPPTIPQIIVAAGGLTSETVAALEAADQIFLAAPYVPDAAPVLIIPDPAEDAGLCTVYLYSEAIDNTKRLGIAVQFELLGGPIKSERILELAKKTLTTDGNGFGQITLQRTDLLTPTGRKYIVNCAALGWRNVLLELTTETFDLANLIA